MFKKRVLFFVFMIAVLIVGCMGNKEEKEREESVKLKMKRSAGTIYFRGTPNSWGKSEMKQGDNGLWQITALFDGKGNPDRFKIDVSGNWSSAYPATDFKITEGAGSYLISFNEETKEISAEKLPKLKLINTSAVVIKNSTEFILPVTGNYIKEDGTVESVKLNWSPALDLTTTGIKEYTAEYEGNKAVFTLKVKAADEKETEYKNGVYFRGTANSWEKTEMVLKDDYIWETFMTFDGKESDRFKIDVSGNWSISYPATDFYITEGAGEYTILFNEKTKEIKAVKGVSDKIVLSQYSVTIDKNDIEFNLPQYGTFEKNGVVERTVLPKWTPKLDKTKQGKTSYYAFGLNGGVAKFDVTVNGYTDYPNGVWFRGSSNSWGKTEMESVGNYIRQCVQEFKGLSSDRFKVDVSGNWSIAYPAKDFYITEGAGKYMITFNEKTKEIKVIKMIENDLIEVEAGEVLIKVGKYKVKLGVDYNYYISKYEVTQSEFASLMGFNPSYCVGNSGNNPVENITYFDAADYCNKMSQKEGLIPYYNIVNPIYDEVSNKKRILSATVTKNKSADGYRVPEMEEWVYAANGGVKSTGKSYAGSDLLEETAWYSENSSKNISNLYNPESLYYTYGGTHIVGLKNANELGIYDMCGNVAEMLDGCNNSEMQICGGSWKGDFTDCSTVNAKMLLLYGGLNQKNYGNYIGFRIVRKK